MELFLTTKKKNFWYYWIFNFSNFLVKKYQEFYIYIFKSEIYYVKSLYDFFSISKKEITFVSNDFYVINQYYSIFYFWITKRNIRNIKRVK